MNRVIGETITQFKKKCLSNVLITGESNFDEKSVPTAQSFIRKEIPCYLKESK